MGSKSCRVFWSLQTLVRILFIFREMEVVRGTIEGAMGGFEQRHNLVDILTGLFYCYKCGQKLKYGS